MEGQQVNDIDMKLKQISERMQDAKEEILMLNNIVTDYEYARLKSNKHILLLIYIQFFLMLGGIIIIVGAYMW
jgi:hypothetical protein